MSIAAIVSILQYEVLSPLRLAGFFISIKFIGTTLSIIRYAIFTPGLIVILLVVGFVTYTFNSTSTPHSMISLPTVNTLEYAFFDTNLPKVPLAIYISNPVSIEVLLLASMLIY